MSALATELRQELAAAADRTVPTLRKLRRAATHRLKPLEHPEVLSVASELLSD